MIKLKNLLLEKIVLDVKVGDVILGGRFKNKIVKDWQTMVGGSSKYGFKGMPMKFFKDTWHPKIDKEYGMEEAANHYLRTKSMLGWKW